MMDRVFRVFISSVKRLLEEERIMASDCVLQSENLPLSMERFVGIARPIDTVIKYMDKSDVVFLIIGHLYGEIVKDLKKENCPIKDYCGKCELKCTISYTHFEYLYSRYKNKGPYCFVLNGYDDDKFGNTLQNKKIPKSKSGDLTKDYKRGKTKNKEFVKEMEGLFQQYDNIVKLSQNLMTALKDISTDDQFKNIGLVDVNRNYVILCKNGKDIPEYNAKFYSQPGRYIIYCHNFEWVTEEKPEVMSILMKKAEEGVDGDGHNSLTICVQAAYSNTENVNNLRDAGADIEIIPDYINDNLVFSERIHGVHKECILRLKSEDTPNTIKVHKLTMHSDIAPLDVIIALLGHTAGGIQHG